MRLLFFFLYHIHLLFKYLSEGSRPRRSTSRGYPRPPQQVLSAAGPPPLPCEVGRAGEWEEPVDDREPWPAVWPFDAVLVMGRAEQGMYNQLPTTFPDYVILAQVALSRVVTVRNGYPVREWNNRINRMSLDFVVCRKDSSVIAAIEIDDRSHHKADAQVRDAKKDAVLQAAGIPLFRWQARRLPDKRELIEALGTVCVRG